MKINSSPSETLSKLSEGTTTSQSKHEVMMSRHRKKDKGPSEGRNYHREAGRFFYRRFEF